MHDIMLNLYNANYISIKLKGKKKTLQENSSCIRHAVLQCQLYQT